MATEVVERPKIRRLRTARELEGKGLRELARAIAVDSSYLSRIERGLQEPSLPVLLRLLDELGERAVADRIRRLLESP
jgi:transcriptional regulator with XRE-family HTH domain